MHRFFGSWITDQAFCAVASRDVYGASLAPERDRFDAHILFRKTFSYDGSAAVKLFYSADDYCKVYVNGEFASCGPAPSYPFRMRYVLKDITKYLRKGENLIAVHSYYQGLINRVWVSGDDRHGVLFDIVCGGRLLACSDESVRVRRHGGYSPAYIVGYDTQVIDDYDSRSAEDGFERPDYDDAAWEYARLRQDADYRLCPTRSKALIFERMTPVQHAHGDGNAVYDFRTELVGYPYIVARGQAGDTVEIFCGEELDPDGHVRYRMRCNCEYRERWTLSGREDTFVPFDYKAFRYLEIKKPSHCTVRVQAIARHYPFKLRRTCAAQDPTLRKIFDLCVNTLRYAVQESYLDCPSREKGQYFGDGVWSAFTHMALTGDTSLYKKLVCDAFDSAAIRPGGTAQGPCSYLQLIAEFPLLVIASLPYYQKLTGDAAFVQSKGKDALSILSYYADTYADADGLVSVFDRWNVVDWPPSARDGYDFDLSQDHAVYGKHNVINGYWYLAVKAYETLYGKNARFSAEKIKRAYKQRFYDRAASVFYDSEHSRHTALASQLFGVLMNAADDEKAAARLLDMVREKRLTASNLFITPVLFAWLQKSGQTECLFDLIGDRDAWANMLKEGATTAFEAFSKDKKQNASLCHTMFAFPALFMADGGKSVSSAQIETDGCNFLFAFSPELG